MEDESCLLTEVELDQDTPCVACGYNLRGLESGGRCPECATPVAQSLQGHLLRFADRRWFRRIRIGVALLIWFSALSCVYYPLIMMRAVAGSSILLGAVARHAKFLLVLMQIAGLAGTFLITSAEPRLAYARDSRVLARAARLCAVIVCVGHGLFLVSQSMAAVAVGAFWSRLGTAAWVLIFSGTIQHLGQLVYLRRLARRIPHFGLARWTTPVLWGLPISSGMHIAIVIASAMVTFRPQYVGTMVFVSLGRAAFEEAASIGYVAQGLFLTCYFVLLLFYRRWFARAATGRQLPGPAPNIDAAAARSSDPSPQKTRRVRFRLATVAVAYPLLAFFLAKCTWWVAIVSLGHEPQQRQDDPLNINLAVSALYVVTLITCECMVFCLPTAWLVILANAWFRRGNDRGLRAVAVLVLSSMASLWAYLEWSRTFGSFTIW
ncbi:MAG: hypothetical protein JXB13_21750 [Phycisphaerae bacterium]|nr:hypothetical protein [Phycisphaerae bacterium]